MTDTTARFSRASFQALRRFPHQISITSKTGVGGTSLVVELKKRFVDMPYRWVSGGTLMRTRATELGMTIEQFARHNKLNPEEGHDRWCDERIAELAEQDWMVCEGRLSHVFMPGAFKVLLVCDMGLRVDRRSRDFPDLARWEVLRDMENRDRDDDSRYLELYPGCLWGPKDFDLVLDTGRLSVEREAETILSKHKEWASGIK